MRLGDLVQRKGFPHKGKIIRDLGVLTPGGSSAPLSDNYPPEQAWLVDFWIAGRLHDSRPGFFDQRGCWESDLEPAGDQHASQQDAVR